MNVFLLGVSTTILVALGALILVGLLKGVWRTAVQSAGLFWLLGWSCFLLAFCYALQAFGDNSATIVLLTQLASVLFHAAVLSYVSIYLINNWKSDAT